MFEANSNTTLLQKNEQLLYALEHGIIDLDNVSVKIQLMKKTEILKQHQYKIFEGKDSRWRTYVNDLNKQNKRKLIVKKNKADLENYIVMHYEKQRKKETIVTFNVAYNMYVEYKKNGNYEENTFAKYYSDYNRFFKDTVFGNTRIELLTNDDIEHFLFNAVTTFTLASQAFCNLRGYIKNTFNFAYTRYMITENVFLRANTEIAKSKTYKKYVEDSEKIVFEEDLQKLISCLYQDIEKQPLYMPNYCILICIWYGLRLSECPAIQWDSLKKDKLIICKSERRKRFYNSDGTISYVTEIGPTKNHQTRSLDLIKQADELFKRINSIQEQNNIHSEFVFEGLDGRVTASTLQSACNRKFEQAGLSRKSIQHLRRTFCSSLRQKGVSAAAVSVLAGHKIRTDDNNYTYNVEAPRLLKNALQDRCDQI